jgi:hypothetical protein
MCLGLTVLCCVLVMTAVEWTVKQTGSCLTRPLMPNRQDESECPAAAVPVASVIHVARATPCVFCCWCDMLVGVWVLTMRPTPAA